MTQMRDMKEALEMEKIKAIQEQLSGFVLEEVVNPAGSSIMMVQICDTSSLHCKFSIDELVNNVCNRRPFLLIDINTFKTNMNACFHFHKAICPQ